MPWARRTRSLQAPLVGAEPTLPTTLRGPVSVKQLYEHGDLPGGSRSRPADRHSARLLLAATMSSNRRFVRGEWTHLGHQSEALAVARSHQGAGHRRSRQSRADSTPGFTSFGHRWDRRVIDRIDNRTRRNLGRVSRIRVPTLSMQTATPHRGRVAGEFAPVYRERAERVRSACEAALGPDAEHVCAEGERLGVDDAAALAFGTRRPRRPRPPA
jgi:hypothetical protein